MKISTRIHLVGSEQFALSHPLDCSCYLLDGGSALGLVDSGLGLGADEILQNIISAGFDPRRLTHILLTHSHVGHWGGCLQIRERTGAAVCIHEAGAPVMSDITGDQGIQINRRFDRYPDGFEPAPCIPDRTFVDGEQILIGDLEVQAIHTQGHTKDSACFKVVHDGIRVLFTGDTVFYGGKIGLLNLEGCSFSDYRRDIHKLGGLDIDMLLPGHGVFTVRRGQKHIDRAIGKLGDFVLPESFFETNEILWNREYLKMMSV